MSRHRRRRLRRQRVRRREVTRRLSLLEQAQTWIYRLTEFPSLLADAPHLQQLLHLMRRIERGMVAELLELGVLRLRLNADPWTRWQPREGTAAALRVQADPVERAAARGLERLT